MRQIDKSGSKSASQEKTFFRLCQAICSLKRREEALRVFLGSEEVDFDEIVELEQALLDLCGVPEERNAHLMGPGYEYQPGDFSRDAWREILADLTSGSTEKDFRKILAKIERDKRLHLIEQNVDPAELH